jgi:hypothetical protein
MWKVLILVILFCSLILGDVKKEKGLTPDKPIITTWSKIKELFQ